MNRETFRQPSPDNLKALAEPEGNDAAESCGCSAEKSTGRRERGRPKKLKLTPQDLLLLTIYFNLKKDGLRPKTLIREISEIIFGATKNSPYYKLQSAEALEKRIRRLIQNAELRKTPLEDSNYPDWLNLEMLK
jgi:hypothetical protein